ncbi:hypothetical protein CJ010_09225 [Azoarcus sp. DD4]|uniref:DUF2784 domain-containing protein n=1 Tax=Azoarcus sp. DD4 TaxID=2027405 RepID=UPI00112A8123|nr:DUF2784 domain-containing protein [Azoarcus sp. DD4]QDF96697.1 hypothetical protein CJ010_09225 [Azoarcus sp. DD4]
MPTPPYRLLADLVLAIHFALVLFVIGGLVAIVIGNRLSWPWVNRWSFRAAHLAAIAIVVLESWLGLACPLTTLEMWLRAQAGTAVHEQGFVAYWLQRLLFYEAPAWVFGLAYTVFGLLVAAAWWRFPPARSARRRPHARRNSGI